MSVLNSECVLLPDLRTIILVLVITSFISAIALFLFYRLLKDVKGLQYAAVGAGFQAVASFFLLLRESIDVTLSIMVTNISYFLAFVFYYQASRQLTDSKPAWSFPIAVVIVLSPFFWWLQDSHYLAERIIVSSVGVSTLTFITSYVLWKNAQNLPGRLGVSLTFLLLSIISFWRIVSMTYTPVGDMTFFDFNSGYAIFLMGIISSFVITVGFIVLTSEKLHGQLRHQVNQASYARDIAQQSLKEQQHFLSMLSHEFKAPIGAIKANADAVLMLPKEKTPIVDESMQRIKQVTERLTSLVDRCLNDEWMAHSIEQGEHELYDLSLSDVLNNISAEYDIPVIRALNTDARVTGDAMFLKVLFSNLVANALKYAEHRASVSMELLETEGDYIINVKDDGPGISIQHQPYLFDKYFRVDNANSTSGSGLGLYFAKRICEMHKAVISLHCEQYTTFTVKIAKSRVEYA